MSKKPAADKKPAKPADASKASQYERHKALTLRRQKELSESGRDIGEIPAVVDPARKAAAEKSFRVFAETYFPATFSMPWSDDHLKVIAAIETSVVSGGLFAFAMPRGSGKTTLVETAALWSLLYGFRDFVAIIGSDEAHASTMLDSIKVECETNELLAEDFPEALYPILALERIHQRAKGQLYQGKPTFIQWTADEVQFPAIDKSKAAGGIIRVAGITGRIRGMSAKRAADGRKVRPSLVLIDDPQTDESARSPAQVAARESVLKGAILGLAGPGCKIAGLCTVTVVSPDDLADRLLDRQRHPAWQGQRTALVYEWPGNTSLWDQYADLRRAGQRSGEGVAAANEFYAAHQGEMDAGARVAWPARKQEDELTAIQHAWNLRIDRGEPAFFAEFQNVPVVDDAKSEQLKAAEVVGRAIKVPRWIVPAGMSTLTAFVDVQERALYWAVVAWGDQLRGHLVAYGTYPDQGRAFFTLRDVKKTLVRAAGGASLEAAIHAGLEHLASDLLGREFSREDDDASLRVSLMLIDSNWAQSAGVVRDFARRSQWATRVMPASGRFVGASGSTMTDRKPDRGERVGSNWRTSTIQRVKHLQFDTNAWKSFFATRAKLPIGDPQAFTLHAGSHDLLAEHLASEYPTRVESKVRTVDEWRLIPGRDNHWLDCCVGAAVAASFTGVSAVGVDSRPGRGDRRVISKESMAKKREELMARMGR